MNKNYREVKSFSDNKLVVVDKVEIKGGGHDSHNLHNFSNWLNHLFNITETKPEEIFKDGTLLLVHYTYKNKEYTIYINKEFDHTKVDISDHNLKRNVLMGTIVNESESRDITNELKRFIGPNCDFYNNNGNDLKHILHNLNLDDWYHINIMDSFGKTITIDLKETKCIDWNESGVKDMNS
jgi:hypothetical protein